MSHTVFAVQLLGFHKKTLTHPQQISLLTVQYVDDSLFIKWKWIIIKDFILVVFIPNE